MSAAPDAVRVIDVPHRLVHPTIAPERRFRLWNRRGMFPSRKSGLGVPFHGPLEREALVLLETENWVLRIEGRTKTLEFWDGRAWREHVPTFVVETTNGPLLVDVRGARRAPGRLQLGSLAASCRAAGYAHMLLTDREIRVQPLLANRERVRAASARSIPPGHLREVLQALERTSSVTADGLVRSTPLSETEAMSACLNLVWRGALAVDFGRPIDGLSAFRRARR